MPLPLHSIPRNPQIFTDRLRLRPVDNRLSKICGPGATISQPLTLVSIRMGPLNQNGMVRIMPPARSIGAPRKTCVDS